MTVSPCAVRDCQNKAAPLAVAPIDRAKLSAGIITDLVELSDDSLAELRLVVARTLEIERANGNARPIDGAALAEAQRQRESA